MKYLCSLCNYESENKHCVANHIARKIKCAVGDPEIIEVKTDILCEYCNKSFTIRPNLIRHIKTCKIKKSNLEKDIIIKNEEVKELKDKLIVSKSIIDKNKKEEEEEVRELKEKLIISNSINEKNMKNIEELKIKYNKLEKTVSLLVGKKTLGNTNVETIRAQSRKKYKENCVNMECVHCGHSGSTQVCHIKAISDFNNLSLLEDINSLSNLIGLCPNCHIDLDKHKKLEVVRTSLLHSMLVKRISLYD